MRASNEFLRNLESLLAEYTREVKEKETRGILARDTAKTYLTHSSNFVRWCRGEFVPGASKGNQ